MVRQLGETLKGGARARQTVVTTASLSNIQPWQKARLYHSYRPFYVVTLGENKL